MPRHASRVLLVHFYFSAKEASALLAAPRGALHHLLSDDSHCRSPAHLGNIEARVHAGQLAGKKDSDGQPVLSEFDCHKFFVGIHHGIAVPSRRFRCGLTGGSSHWIVVRGASSSDWIRK